MAALVYCSTADAIKAFAHNFAFGAVGSKSNPGDKSSGELVAGLVVHLYDTSAEARGAVSLNEGPLGTTGVKDQPDEGFV